MGEMTGSELTAAIVAGDVDRAVSAVVDGARRADAVIAGFSEDDQSAHAPEFVRFARAWSEAAPLGDRLPIARWVTTQAPLAFSDAEDARALAAQLLVAVARDTGEAIAGMAADAWVLADGPDAGIGEDDAAALQRAGEHLRAVEWPSL